MPRVFLLEPMIKHAEGEKTLQQFGEIVYLFRGNGQESRPSVFDTDNFGDAIHDKLTALDFDPAIDFIVVSGSRNQIANLVGVCCNGFGECRALLYNEAKREYTSGKLG